MAPTQGVNVGVGVGVALGIFAAIAVILAFVGIRTAGRSGRDVSAEREMEQRREAMRRRHEEEQTQWRQRRLQDVVLVLVDRGEAFEGVPLAFQLPGRREVAAKRDLKRRNTRRAMAQQLEEEFQQQDENARLGPEVLAIANKPLCELLENGRPPDAEPAPDIMQMLLEGGGDLPRYHESEDGNNEHDDDDEADSEYFTDVSQEGDERHSPNAFVSVSPSRALSRMLSRIPSANDSFASPEGLDPEELEREREKERERRRQEAIIELLHARQQPPSRRRKTAEEVYGYGHDYMPNVANTKVKYELRSPLGVPEDSVNNFDSSGRPLMANNEAPMSPLRRILAPFSPTKSKSARPGSTVGTATEVNRSSAFDGRNPSEGPVHVDAAAMSSAHVMSPDASASYRAPNVFGSGGREYVESDHELQLRPHADGRRPSRKNKCTSPTSGNHSSRREFTPFANSSTADDFV